MRNSRILFIFLALLVGYTLDAAWAADTQASAFVTIPVYYLTDREMDGDSFTARRRYHALCQHEMYFGTANVTVPNTLKKSDSALFQRLGWQSTNDKAQKIAPKDKIDPADYPQAKKQFFARLTHAMDQAESNALCVYVHGACDGFEDCAQDAASMAYYLERPVVLYSWPAHSNWRSYYQDSVNSEWSQGHFNIFCKDLIALKDEHPMQIVFLSHSMGNRLVIRSLPITYGKGLVTDWELISPDMDADTTRHYILGITPDQSKIRIFVSNRDKLLPISQMMAGGYYRLGEAANVVSPPPALRAVPPGQMERIDFTDIDTGFTGHSIPFDLIANLMKNNQPGLHLELIPETEVHANRLVKFANRKSGLNKMPGDLPSEFCKRVVRVDSSSK